MQTSSHLNKNRMIPALFVIWWKSYDFQNEYFHSKQNTPEGAGDICDKIMTAGSWSGMAYWWTTHHISGSSGKQSLRYLIFTSPMTPKDSQKLCKRQVKDRCLIWIKRKLPNDDISSFESLTCGDPYGNWKSRRTFRGLLWYTEKPENTAF